MENTITRKASKSANFVNYVLQRLQKDTGFGAKLRRADNPDTEYQSYECLAKWCSLDKDHERTCFATVAAGLARMKKSSKENISFGAVIARCSDSSKLLRLLACDFDEICQWIRPILRLAESKNIYPNFERLLNDLLYFNQKTKQRWAMDFYRKENNNDSINADIE
jgi:CRISPR system Cascade subunit CasB